MNKHLCAALLAVGLLAAAGQKASAWGCCDGSGHSHFFPCFGVVPGPWYTYWPTGPCGTMATSENYCGWKYPCHFQAPVPVGDSFCSDYGGFYPGYWYGR